MDFSSSSHSRLAGHDERSNEPTASPEVKMESADQEAPTSLVPAMPAEGVKQDADLEHDLPAMVAPMAPMLRQAPSARRCCSYNNSANTNSNNDNGFYPSPGVDYGTPYTGSHCHLHGQEYGANAKAPTWDSTSCFFPKPEPVSHQSLAPYQTLYQYPEQVYAVPDPSTMPDQLHLPYMAGASGLGAMPTGYEYGYPGCDSSPSSPGFGSVPPLVPSSDYGDGSLVGMMETGRQEGQEAQDSFLGYPYAGDVDDGGVLGYRGFLNNHANNDEADVGGAGSGVMAHARRNVNGNKGEEPYAQLICRALLSVKSRAMTLQEIYTWFKQNTDKDRGDGSRGWQNSVRHNLSMNAAFTKRERKLPIPAPAADNQDDDDGSSPELNGYGKALAATTYGSNKSEWFLEDWAFEHGVQSTTRYRKHHAGGRRARGVATGRIRRRSRARTPNVAVLQHGLQRFAFPQSYGGGGGGGGGGYQPPRFDEPVTPPGENQVAFGGLNPLLPFDGGGEDHAAAVAGADGSDNGFGQVAPEFAVYSDMGDDADRFGGLWSADGFYQGPY